MKNLFLLLIIILIPLFCFPLAKEGEDLQTLNNLISSTERQLAIYKELRHLMMEFQNQQDQFVKDVQGKELAREMVQTASTILQTAQEHHLLYLLTPFFVEELKFFASLSKKKAP